MEVLAYPNRSGYCLTIEARPSKPSERKRNMKTNDFEVFTQVIREGFGNQPVGTQMRHVLSAESIEAARDHISREFPAEKIISVRAWGCTARPGVFGVRREIDPAQDAWVGIA